MSISGNLYADLFKLITDINNFRSCLDEMAVRYPVNAEQFVGYENQMLEMKRSLEQLRSTIN